MFVTEMSYNIRDMTLDDYSDVCRLWEQTEGMSLEEDDSREAIAIYLRRNQGLCFVACVDGKIVGTVLCGHEGRRGILRHLAVTSDFRKKGVARALVNKCLAALAEQGVRKCNIFVLDENVEGLRFWDRMGWYRLPDNYRTLQILTENQR
jgi:ribosomal protein S18 acetylase RimI-like enzyme